VSVPVVLAGGESATLLALSIDAVRLLSPVAAPPGARLEATLASDGGTRLRIKVHSSRRLEEGAFLVEGRPLDLARGTREKIAKLLAPR
jgi:hypothetical protein